MKKTLLPITMFFTILITSCSDNIETKKSLSEETSTPVTEFLKGQWKTEGNEGIVSKWLEFDSLKNDFYAWSDEEKRPSSISGNFKVIGDSIIEFSYTEYPETQQYAIKSIKDDKLEIISVGVSAGNLVYKKTIYIPKETEKSKNNELTVSCKLKAVNESDFWGRVYLVAEIDGEETLFDYYYKDNEEFNSLELLIDKRVSISYAIVEAFEGVDLYYDGASIHGKYGGVKTEEDKNRYTSIEGTLIAREEDISGDTPGNYRIVSNDGDTTSIISFVYESHVALNGKTVTAYYSITNRQVAKSLTSIEGQEVMNTQFFGDWFVDRSKGDVFGSQVIKIRPGDENGVYIDFGQGSNYIKTDIYTNIILGKNTGGKFILELKEGAILDYSDDGMGGHYEPIKNQEYNTIKSKNLSLIKGKWKGINGTEGSIEFTDKEMIDNHSKSPYVLSNICMNEKITTLPTDEVVYISTIDLKYDGLSWMILELDDNYLKYNYLGTANDFEFERVK